MIKKNLLLILILFISLSIRLYNINELPLFGDEIDVGYQAYSLLLTSRDVKGNFLPTYISSFSESRAPALIYFTIPSIFLFGLNSFSVRLVPIIFGIFSTIYFYAIILKLSKSKPLALISAFILTITPWHIHYSRASFELTLLSSFILSGTYYLLKYFETNKNILFTISTILFSLTFYTYNISNIFVPLLVLFILLTNKNKLTNLKVLIINFILGLILIFPIISSIISGTAANRFKLISIFNDPTLTNEIIESRTDFSTSNSPLVEKTFHNKLISYSKKVIENYLSAFSPQFIFINGDPNPRHNIPNQNLILLPLIVPLIIGIIYSLKNYNNLSNLFYFWLLISPISSSLTQGGQNHASRLFLMIFPLIYFISLGIHQSNKITKSLIIFISTIFLIIFLHEYFIHYPKKYFENWQFGYSSLYNVQIKQPHRLFISNSNYESLPRYIFYQKINPVEIQKTSDIEVNNIIEDMSGFNINSNTYFINNWSSSDVLNKIRTIAKTDDIFYLLQIKDIPGDMDFSKKPLNGFKTIKTVYYPNQQIMGQVLQKL